MQYTYTITVLSLCHFLSSRMSAEERANYALTLALTFALSQKSGSLTSYVGHFVVVATQKPKLSQFTGCCTPGFPVKHREVGMGGLQAFSPAVCRPSWHPNGHELTRTAI